MNGEVFIHVGIEKTGSTFLQSVITKNENLLRKHGVHYVESGRESNHHYWLAKALDFKYKPTPIDAKKETKALNNISREINKIRDKHLLLSSEHFDFNLNERNTTNLVNLFEGRTVNIIMLLRNQVDYSQSLYLEHLKWGGLKTYAQFLNQFSKQRRWDFLHRHTVWKNTGANVRVIDYDAHQKNILETFFEDLPLTDIVGELAINRKNEHATPSIDLMEFVRLINHAVPKNKRRELFLNILKKSTKDIPKLLNKRPFPIPESSKTALQIQQERNTKLAEVLGVPSNTFLGRPLYDRLNELDHALEPNIEKIISNYFT